MNEINQNNCEECNTTRIVKKLLYKHKEKRKRNVALITIITLILISSISIGVMIDGIAMIKMCNGRGIYPIALGILILFVGCEYLTKYELNKRNEIEDDYK